MMIVISHDIVNLVQDKQYTYFILQFTVFVCGTLQLNFTVSIYKQSAFNFQK